MIGKKFKHRHLAEFSCEIISSTAKGYKVKQTEYLGRKKAPKSKTAFYNSQDFTDGGLWTEM